MHPPSTFVTDIAMVAGVAAITGMIARAVGLPTILGYLFAGLVVGPPCRSRCSPTRTGSRPSPSSA